MKTRLGWTALAFLFVLISACSPSAAAPTLIPFGGAQTVLTQNDRVPITTDTPPSTAPATPVDTVGALGQRTKTSGCISRNGLPESDCTPGAIFGEATSDQICTPGYSKAVRNVPNEVKDQVYAEYGITQHSPGQYEVDHLIPLELGGSNDIANLWPEPAEPRPGFHEKDQLENSLHGQVCSGAMSLQEAQYQIATNWLATYLGPPASNSSLPQDTATPEIVLATPSIGPRDALDLQVVSLTSPIRHGQTATLVIRTLPNASCTITVHYKSGPSKAKGLDPKTADANGQCSWTWNVGSNTTPGTWSITVGASLDGQLKSLSLPFVIQ